MRGDGTSVSAIMRSNEAVPRSDAEIVQALLRIWQVMQECVRTGCERGGHLPGGLRVPRRAHRLHARLQTRQSRDDLLSAMDWLSLFALAANEENASGGRMVTAPTNGAAGIVPAVLHYYTRFVPGSDEGGVIRFLLTAGAIDSIIKRNASISGAEVGCHGGIGSACAMADAGLTEVLGGAPEQVENAPEIAIEHHLGLTCDPVGGLVQIPSVERNAVGATKAELASGGGHAGYTPPACLHGDGHHIVTPRPGAGA